MSSIVEAATNQNSELAALDQVRAELELLPADDLLQQNVVAIDVLVTVRGVLRELLALRPLMLQLPRFNVANLDRLELYAMAFAGAHAQYQILKEHNKEPAALIREGLALRKRLVNDIRVLVRRGLVAPEPLRNLHNRHSYSKVAADLLLLAAIFHTHASIIAARCAVTSEEVARAYKLADKLTVVVSHRSTPLEAEAKAVKMRQQAFTVFFRAYSQVRRAVQYLRYDEGDADRFAPPPTGKRKKNAPTAQQKPAERGEATTHAAEKETHNFTKPAGVVLPGSDPFSIGSPSMLSSGK